MTTPDQLLFIGSALNAILGLFWLLLLIYTLWDLFNRSLPINTKLLWLIVILIAPVLGSLIYLLWGRQGRF